MNKLSHLHVQAIELKELLENAGPDPLMVPQLKVRLAAVQQEISEANRQTGSLLPLESVTIPRTAIFLRGEAIADSVGIRPGLAGEVLIQYEKMFTEQALHEEREFAKQSGKERRPKGSPVPGLLFTGTPRGSFGFEFVPQTSDQNNLLKIHEHSLTSIADILIQVTDPDSNRFNDNLKNVAPGVIRPLKHFLKTLSDNKAELRLAFHNKPSRALTVPSIQLAAERLEKEVVQIELTLSGKFRGVTRESGYFDFIVSENGEVISGQVADELTEEKLEEIHSLTNKIATASFQKTTITSVAGTQLYYVLLGVSEPSTQDPGLPSQGRSVLERPAD